MCDCIAQANEKLAAHNTVIDTASVIEPVKGSKTQARWRERVVVATRKLNNRVRAHKVVMARYCPFCGEEFKDN